MRQYNNNLNQPCLDTTTLTYVVVNNDYFEYWFKDTDTAKSFTDNIILISENQQEEYLLRFHIETRTVTGFLFKTKENKTMFVQNREYAQYPLIFPDATTATKHYIIRKLMSEPEIKGILASIELDPNKNIFDNSEMEIIKNAISKEENRGKLSSIELNILGLDV